ncbi:DEHA2D03366p [Debaryomyces hansenii CBS767]|uniref:Prefoldin subunit 4 n=1 Tax=Debaryomyces hansenii (strain ATCC 36239 / CBS 767 / BCRC 21394 / JCM 1990 / NBRC 0083 / IGC 2968) TaxID=284592 RepID=Q6BT56_DEBHA|nr:DEHA2D03366p [Debaryomyces hansenii CBS767]CAG86750.2 DEHA2D03366p [Debaryomyces hansenii CBS767]|eukprot:XP_458614.2 DEHA2D03366p [Debaryomyces hansenii CBS767]
MELLPDGQRNTATEVSWDDQQKINKFSTLINKKDENLEVLKKLKEEKEYLDDLSLEIELLDEDEKIQYKVGEVFIFMKVNKVIEKIEVDNEVLTEKISNIESSVDEIDDSLESYKKQLYARFGNNINLER